MNENYVLSIIAGMAVLNFAVRFTPIAIVSRLELPRPVMRWLSYIPIAVMGALVSAEVLRPGGEDILPWRNPYLFAAIPTALAYQKSRSFMGSIVVGIIAFIAIRALMGW